MLCTAAGILLGAAAPFAVPSDDDRDVAEVVAAAGWILHVEVRVLRVLESSDEVGVGGRRAVTYLAEVATAPVMDLAAWPGDRVAGHPKRLAYAEPGVHQHDLDWATSTLDTLGIMVTAPPVQVRTWSLSSIWRLSTSRGLVWLKVVPAFCAAEPAVLPLLDHRVVPVVLGAAPDRVLLTDVPGHDQYGATGEEWRSMARMLIDLQKEWTQRIPELERVGVADKRPAAAIPAIVRVVDRHRRLLDPDTARALDSIVERLPERFTALDSCGVPDTLVHGDFYPGNVRGVPGAYRILDWSHCGIGNPMLDLRPSVERMTPQDQRQWISIWADGWSRVVPGCAARRAAELARPLGPMLGAVTYQLFLDNLETTERHYFDGDPLRALGRAVAAAST